jgi:transposase
VDEQISSLLESVELEVSDADPPRPGVREADLPRRARRPRKVSTSAPSRPLVRKHVTKAVLDREPTVARTVKTRGRVAPGPRGLELPRAHIRRRRRLLEDPVSRERAYFIIAALVSGTGIGLLCALVLG